MTWNNLKPHIQNAVATEESARALVSDDPNARGAARSNLINAITNLPGLPVITDQTADSFILGHAPAAQAIYEGRARTVFRPDPDAVIEDARRNTGDKFKANYLKVNPVPTGNALFDEVGALHTPYRGLADLVEDFSHSDDKTVARAQFVQAAAPYMDAHMESNLLEGLDADEVIALRGQIDHVKHGFLSVYQDVSAETAVKLAGIVSATMKRRIEAKLPENQRADYTEAMLKAAAHDAQTTYAANPAEGRKKFTGVIRDLFEVAA